MSRPETRHDFDPYDGEPGKAWDDFDERLLNFTSGKTDDRGYSIADTLLEQDEGAASGPAFPVGVPAELRKAHAAARRRQKDAFSILLRHQTHPDHVKHLSANHFQDGVNAYKYLKASSQTAVNAIRLRELRRLWDDLDMMEIVGVQEHSVARLATKIVAQNAEFPNANRKDRTECTERLMEMMMDCSKHFAESITDEYNSTVGNRRFEHVAHAVHGNHRDFDALVKHYDDLWSSAFNSKLAGFEPKQPTRRPRQSGNQAQQPPLGGRAGRESPSRSHGESGMSARHEGMQWAQPRGEWQPRASAALGGARRVERSGLYYLPYQGGDPA